MTWSDFYLICFAVGFCFSFFSFLFGGTHSGRLHLPHFHGHGAGHVPAAHAPTAASATNAPAAGAASHGAAKAGMRATAHASVSPFNFATVMAFLAWFGAAGFLLTRYSSIRVGFELLLSVVSGLIGGGIIFLFLSRVLISSEENMDPADYEMVGVLGRIASPVRADGTGELVYSQMGTRRVCGVRSDDGSSLAKGVEVVVTRYEKGIAYARLWSEMSGEESAPERPGEARGESSTQRS
jgi:hypothetical protein